MKAFTTLPKRNQMLVVVAATGLVLAGLWFGIIQSQKQALSNIARTKADVRAKLDQFNLAIKSADKIDAECKEARQLLANKESLMAHGDLYAWAIGFVRQFKSSYRVDIPQFSQVDGPREVSMLPRFPYHQATLTIGGTAFFHDLGRFIADLENQNPYIRVQNLTLEPARSANADDAEKLSFRFEVITLVRPSA
jgi:Tfp pilus assembly protein PilO